MYAQIPAANNDQLATAVIIVAIVLWIANQVKNFFDKPIKSEGQKTIVRDDLDREVIALKSAIENLRVTTSTVDHELREALQTISVRIETTHREMKQDMKETIDRVVDRLTETEKRLERAAALIETRINGFNEKTAHGNRS